MKKIISIILIAAVFISCNRDDSDPREIPLGEVEVDLNIVVTAQSNTRAFTSDEGKINNLHVLVFDASSAEAQVDANKATFMYYRHAWLKGTDTYRTILKTGTKLDLYFAANVEALISGSGLTEGATYEAVRNALLLEAPEQITKDNLPMWGVALGKTIGETDTYVNLGGVRLLRSVASTDITVMDDADFVFEKAYIVNATTKGFLAHRSDNVNAVTGQIVAPQVPGGADYDFSWSAVPVANASGYLSVENVFYMYENDATASTTQQYTKLIVEGQYKNNTTTYYPIAFRKADNDTKVQVARNRKFIISILKVNGDGYPSIEEAKDAEDVNAIYEVIEWDENNDSDIIIDGVNYVSFPAGKHMILSDLSETTARLYFKTNALQMDGNYMPENLIMSFDSDFSTKTTDGRIYNDRFDVKLVVDESDLSGEAYCLVVTAKADYTNAAAGDHAATLYLKIGRIQFRVELKQVPNNWNNGGDTSVNW